MSRLIPEIEGFRRLSLEFVDGLGGQMEVLSFKDGADVRVRRRPGPVSWSIVTVRRTRSGVPRLWRWWKQTVDGGEQRRKLTVRHVNDRGRVLAKWTLHGCWPTGWRLVDAGGAGRKSDHVEELTLAVENMELN